MFVFAARRIWAECRDADTILGFGGEVAPDFGGAVVFGRNPAFDVPAVVRDIFRHLPRFDGLAQDVAAGVAVRPSAADPCESRASPDDAEVGLAEAVLTAGAGDAFLQAVGRLMRFADDEDHLEVGQSGPY